MPYDDASGAIATFQDVTEATALERELFDRATFDQLTGLVNRQTVLERLDAVVQDFETGGREAGILFIDIDHFKHVNDTLGHAAGDEFMAAIGSRIQAEVRARDIVGRLGGDEFLVVLPSVADAFEARMIGTRIQAAVNTPFRVGDRDLHASLSIGVALTSPGQTASDLLAADDYAVYEAKAAGRNAVHLFDAEMRERFRQRLDLSNQLRLGLDRPGEITAFFQPIIDLSNARVVGFESLARWDHPERGLLGAGAFIDVAEDAGLEVPIGWSILDQAAEFARRCEDSATSDEPIVVNVNMSSRQLRQDDVVERVSGALARAGASPEWLCIEVTERSLVEDLDAASKVLEAIRDLGIRTAIDDFGIGNSSLSYLSSLPIDTIKIDMSFTQHLLNGTDGLTIVAGVIRMGRAMNRKVVVEGVENAEQIAVLHSLRCNLVQGFLFSPGVRPDEALDLIGAEFDLSIEPPV